MTELRKLSYNIVRKGLNAGTMFSVGSKEWDSVYNWFLALDGRMLGLTIGVKKSRNI